MKSRSPRGPTALLSALLAVLLACATAAAATAAGGSRWGAGYIPNAPVLAQDGRALRFFDDALKGKIAVISFIYTSCRDICPIVTARLSQLEEKLGDAVGRDIFFVSVSIDPEVDTPAKLRDYAEAFGVGPSWLFLTGDKAHIDLIRHKLGERSRLKTDHRNEVLLYNDATGEWERGSAFGDLNVLAATVRAMDPRRRSEGSPVEPAKSPAILDNPLDVPGQALFIKTCGACHTIGGGDRVGPDLGGVLGRRTREWVARYITAPEKVRAEKDPAALAMMARFRAVRMPNLGMSDDDAADLVAYLDARTYATALNAKPHAHHHH